MPFLFLLAFSFAAEVDAQWLKLMHYEKNLIGTYHSRASSDGFFTSTERSPESELNQFLIDYDKRPIDDKHVVCRFPYRAKYVVNKGYKAAIKTPNCPTLEKFRATVAPVGVSLLFSSYFLDSPASTFGHTFLRLRRNSLKVATEHQIELLDHGIGYAANPSTMNPLLYSVLGFVGGFDGVFSMVPYYYKVREYNDAESRDLWSYDLDMSPQQMADLVDHLWEVGQATFPYYYLTENCSYYILEILEIVTGWKLLDRMPFWIIPVDTLKAVTSEPGFVKEVSYRPSLKSQFEERVRYLSTAEQKQVRSLRYEPTWTTVQIDAAIEFLELKFAKQVRTPGTEELKLRDEFLAARASRRESSRLQVPKPPSPDQIHPSSRMGMHLGYHETFKNYLGVEQRFAYYDPLDPPQAKPAFSEIIFMDIAARFYPHTNDFDIQKTDLLRVRIRNPYTLWLSPWSYSLTVGGIRDSILCDSCYGFRTHFDLGLSYLFTDKHLVYLGVYNDLRTSAKMSRGFGYYLGPLAEFTDYWFNNFRSQLRLTYLDVIDRNQTAFWDISAEIRWDIQPNKFSLSLRQSWVDEIQDIQLSLYYYY